MNLFFAAVCDGMKLRVFLLVIILQISTSGSAKDWFEGVVFLKDKKVLRGEISVRPDCDVVLFRIGEIEMVYPAHRIVSLSFFDDDLKEKRTFISILTEAGAVRAYELYEVVIDGEISILRKELSSWQSYYLEVEDFAYFAFLNDELLDLKTFRRRVYKKLLKDHAADIDEYVRAHNLSPYSFMDMVRVINKINVEKKARALARGH